MFELRDLERRIRQGPDFMEPEELRANFERLQANVREVQAEAVEHRRLEEEQRRKERKEKEKEGTEDLDGDSLDTAPLIKLRNVGNLQSAVPNDLSNS